MHEQQILFKRKNDTPMAAQLGSAERPLRVAVIGSGPAGFYAAESLLKRPNLTCSIDIFNRFPTPYGLVRDGVAPDHQSIKSVTRVFDKILENPQVRFFGNVTFGKDISHDEIKRYYDQIIYAVGAQTDRRMGIPGEDFLGSFPATAFVGWYNGHPDYRDLEFDLSCERVVVVGNGNVAMDVTRILAADPDELAKSDIADHALAALRKSKIREIMMLGRRGPAQSSFTNPELKEFGELAGVDVRVDPADLALDELSEQSLAENRVAAKNMETLREYALKTTFPAPRRIYMRFLYSPVEILGEDGKMTGVVIERNQLVPDGKGGLKAIGNGVKDRIRAGMILRSVGYKGQPLADVPFNEANATIANVAGRVVDPATQEPVAGEYVVGWIKRGPSGLIGNNKPDSIATADAMVEDISSVTPIDDENRDPAKISTLLAERGVVIVNSNDWKKLNEYELNMGKQQGRPRVKVTRVDEMLSIINK